MSGADRLQKYIPEGLNRVFVTNSCSESVDSALMIALVHHRARICMIGRERGYHGVKFAGTAAGDIGAGPSAPYDEEWLLMRGKEMQPKLGPAIHNLKGQANVIDIRNTWSR